MISALLIGAEALHALAAMVLFGVPLFLLYAGRGLDVRLMLIAALCSAWLSWLLVGVSQTAEMAGDPGAAFDPSMLSAALDTRFGTVWSSRVVLLALVTAIFLLRGSRAARIAQTVSAATLLASLALLGHSGAALSDGRALPAIVDALHMLVAGVWIGALAALWSIAFQRPTASVALAHGLGRFSMIGPLVVGVLVLSGLANAWFVMGPTTAAALGDSAYVRVLVVKLALIGAMLMLASLHRYVLGPRLSLGAQSHRELQVSLGLETVLGVLVIAAAALLGATPPPGMD